MASGHHEIELKRLLSGDRAAEAVIAALAAPVADEKRQVNHIFDTEDRRLDKARYAVRLRIENGSAFLTAKGPSRRVAANVGTKTEAEALIGRGDAEAVLAGRLDPVRALRRVLHDSDFAELWRGLDQARAGRTLQRLGQFENLRRTVPVVLPGGLALRVEVDRTFFPNGRVDDEVEIELPSEDVAGEVEAWMDDTARVAGVVMATSTPKILRFFKALADGSK